MIRQLLSAAGSGMVEWWMAAGITPDIAYQPKGAASLEDSYVNLVNPGTYNAVVGVAPTLSADGWVFNGTSQYLRNGVNLPANTPKQVTVIIKYIDNSLNNTGCVFGSTYTSDWFQMQPYYAYLGNNVVGFLNGSNTFILSLASAGSAIAATVGTKAFYNGAMLEGTFVSGSGNANNTTPFIGCRNASGSPSNYWLGTISALFYTRSVLTETQVLAVMAAMGDL